jgi:hypothetical protein
LGILVKRLFAFCVLWFSLVAGYGAYAQLPVLMVGSSNCAKYTTFLNRTTSVDVKHRGAYRQWICNLDVQGVFAKLDAAYLFATNSSSNALLNIVSSSFTAIVNGAPGFTVDAGYLGTAANPTTDFLDTGFNPSTAGGNFAQNAGHVSVWSNTNLNAAASQGSVIGYNEPAFTSTTALIIRQAGNAQGNVNNAYASGVAVADSLGHFVVNRNGGSTNQLYKNASNIQNPNTTSSALVSRNVYILGLQHSTGTTADNGGAYQIMSATIGGNLTAGDVTNLCHETNLYLTTIAGISSGTC